MENNDLIPIIETDRLILRPLVPFDQEDLAQILCDAESMKYYPAPFSLQQVENWILWNIDNYKKYGHGLWAVLLKKGNLFLGDCGITMQEVEGVVYPEVGYHIKREHCNKGYATEAAKACIEFAFNQLDYNTLITYTKHDNIASIKVAEKNNMKFVKHFEKEVMGQTVREVLYAIHR